MLNIPEVLAKDLSLPLPNIQNALNLFLDGATVPFIARYRKEQTGEMNEIILRTLFERSDYLHELEDRKQTVLDSIRHQGKLSDELEHRIKACLQKNELEDLYLPYKPKRRTRATIAREKGLEPLAEAISLCNTLQGHNPTAHQPTLLQMAEAYISTEKGVTNAKEALQGASDILAERIAEKAELRAAIRSYILKNAVISSVVKSEFPEGTTKFEMYRTYSAPIRDIPPHNMLALRRGEAEEILTLSVEFDEEYILQYLESKELMTSNSEIMSFYKALLKDAFERLMKFTLIGEVRLEKKLSADEASVRNFGENLRNLLLASPAGMKPTLGIDPGFRTGCKVAALDKTGKFLEYHAIFPHNSKYEREQAAQTLRYMLTKHNINLVAIGNGTASRETDEFVSEVLSNLEGEKPIKVIVSEAGASVYSASETAAEEFPLLDVTVRGAISIARRLQDPLAELVKIDPKSIGVGQYQHDVDQKLLKKKLDETVETCVNYVGVDVNTASKELLKFVAGISETVAKNIVEYRNQYGIFSSRKDLLNVPKFGAKTFEQAAGFLRIRGGKSALDNSAVHPERYALVQKMADDSGVALEELIGSAEKAKAIELGRYIADNVGLPTLRDIISELEKPGRDPREEFRYAEFQSGISEIRHLQPEMMLEGVVTNVTNFGAFVDIGVHQDGLVHISQMANRYITNPLEVVKVGQIVKVRVVEVNVSLKRISLSMKPPVLSSSTAEKLGRYSSTHNTEQSAQYLPSRKVSESMNDQLELLKEKFAKK
ncbi:MAG: RNA-binding transcriptional accessory protein [Candidatus Kapabacteria bacterium]|jgi:uncharacterized protein|nr:RNA-binding transcriptional accessory protein [Candidatus Kapabacteria bacterium]